MADLIIKDVRIFTGDEVIESGYVHVSNGKITSVGKYLDKPIPLDATVISKPGSTVLPGLIDAHIHADKGKARALFQALAFGVTTVMDMHNENYNMKKLKKICAETKDAADFKSAGVAATVEDGWPAPVVTAHDKSPETLAEVESWPKLKTEDDIEAYVKDNIAQGADYIKIMHESGKAMGAQFTYPTQEFQKQIIDAAHRNGRVAVAHATALNDTLQVLRAGINGLTHTFYDQAPTQELVDAYKINNAWLNPTLVAIGSLTEEGRAEQERFAAHPLAKKWISDEGRENLCRCMSFKAPGSALEYAYESVRQLKAAGIDIICGSDAASPALGTAWGLSIHHELYLFVKKCGFAPEEALRSATSLTAKRFGFADRGRIAPGLKADLILVDGNPIENIEDTLNLKGVWRDGVLCSKYDTKICDVGQERKDIAVLI